MVQVEKSQKHTKAEGSEDTEPSYTSCCSINI